MSLGVVRVGWTTRGYLFVVSLAPTLPEPSFRVFKHMTKGGNRKNIVVGEQTMPPPFRHVEIAE
jgi:hypothetical protein